ncbi:MAG TPA: aminotransferase class I/II-fold pyridoxal phosphate-dependent enzyme [Terriglobia bacterium]|nr:aminotransferase class I/II-fold pyridoxal phosphate-dependent enzyme [Terriglobia bacterium]
MAHRNHPGGATSVAAPLTGEVKPSERSHRIRYAIRDIMLVAQEAQAAGKQLLRLNIGDPPAYDFQTPRHLIEATFEAMLAGHTGYAPSSGIEEALRAIRAESERQGIRSIQEVFVSSGVSEAIEACFAALLNPGENALIPAPGYPLYEAALVKLGAEPVVYQCDEQDGWQPDLDHIARQVNSKTRALVVINPSNPTGAVCRRDTLQGILEIASRHGLVVFSDEIYNRLLLDPVEHIPMGSLTDELPIVTFNGLSKTYLAPGFRMGWIVVSGPPKGLVHYREAIAKMMRARLSANHPAQFAIPAALEGSQEHLPGVLDKLRKRRDLTVSLLNSIPKVRCFPPQAAFYAFPRLQIQRSDEEFVKDLVRQTGVIVVPGSGFGQAPGTQHFRMVFLPPEEILHKALRLLGEFLQRWP